MVYSRNGFVSINGCSVICIACLLPGQATSDQLMIQAAVHYKYMIVHVQLLSKSTILLQCIDFDMLFAYSPNLHI